MKHHRSAGEEAVASGDSTDSTSNADGAPVEIPDSGDRALQRISSCPNANEACLLVSLVSSGNFSSNVAP